MQFHTSSLRSKVAQRIFALFLFCGLLPFAGLLLISYNQVVTFFNDKNEQHLRELTKTLGASIFERLLFLEASLQLIRSGIKASATVPDEAALADNPSNPKERWTAISLLTSSGAHRPLLGHMEGLPEFSAADRRQLATGQPVLLLLDSGPDRRMRIFMSLAMDPSQASADLLIGEVQGSYLWGVDNSRLLPAFVQACVQNQNGAILMCSSGAKESFVGGFTETLRKSATGVVKWTDQGQDYLAAYWTIPMRFQFRVPEWVVLLKTSKAGVFASIADLQRTFLLGILVSVGLSILLAIFQIRRRLVPIDSLQEGTRRFAKKDFEFRVDVQSDDEFAELAGALNEMARQLAHQFNTLATAADIDRAVLSLLDTSKIAETILSRMMSVFRCDCAALTLIDPERHQREAFLLIDGDQNGVLSAADSENRVAMITHTANNRSATLRKHGDSNANEQAELDPVAAIVARTGVPLVLGDLESDPHLADAEFLRTHGFKACIGAPLLVDKKTMGVLAFYSKQRRVYSTDEIDFLTDLTRQAAVAIYNSQLYERTTQQSVELQKANNAKDEFLGLISHEVRTPLNVILGYVKLMHEGILGDLNVDQIHALDTVQKHSNELLDIIERIMDATKIQAGAVAAQFRDTDLPAFIDNLKSKYTILPGKDVALNWDYSFAPPSLRTDAAKLERILHNLIDNAIKFTPKGEVTISVTANPTESSVEFRVADSGIGIAPESFPVIFEMFRQVDNSRTREYGGAGLGLYIANKLTALLGGTIRVESQPGLGSTFTLMLPENRR